MSVDKTEALKNFILSIRITENVDHHFLEVLEGHCHLGWITIGLDELLDIRARTLLTKRVQASSELLADEETVVIGIETVKVDVDLTELLGSDATELGVLNLLLKHLLLLGQELLELLPENIDILCSKGGVLVVRDLTLLHLLGDFVHQDPNATLYEQALAVTHMSDSLAKYIDETYSVGSDSIDWTNDALVMPTATEYDNVAYMEHRYFKYTMFICPDSVLKAKHGITDLDGLRALAKTLYDPMYPEDAGVTDETDRRNSLNRFISYHILDRSATYYQLTCVDGQNSTLANNWARDKWDIADWYETMMPYSIMKFSFPMGQEEGLYINRRGVQSRADGRGVMVKGVKVTEPLQMGRDNTCLNGIYFYISDVVAYDQNTQEVVLNERMRIDASILSPDFMTSGARGHYTNSSYEGGKYGIWDDTSDHNNKNTCLGFKAGAAKNFSYTSQTHLHVRPRVLSF